ncbi:MAG: SDR family NAD(P)-dependent oxidoreductase [Clostridia bacterium]|nr:SDR family NAD(P)-dependent oxidoreductase [Clostridia bacterium]
MICMVLAAGYATRLYPLTENFPKPLLEVKEKSILDWLLDDIKATTDIDRFVIVSNHKFADHFEQWAKTKPYNIDVVDDGTSTEQTRLGAVMDMKFAIDKLNLSGDMLVIAGDNLLDFSLGRFVEYAKDKGTSCLMRYYEKDTEKLQKCGVLSLEGDLISDMEEKPEKPKSNWCVPPFYIYKGEDIARIDEAIADGCGIDSPGALAAWMCKHATVNAMQMPGARYDIGNLKSYQNVMKNYGGINMAKFRPFDPSKKVLVTGAAGFVGFHLCNRLLELGATVVGFDNINNYYDVTLKYARLDILKKQPKFTFVKGDLADADAVNRLFAEGNFDIVVNLAAQAGVRYSIENPKAYIDSNIIGFFNILEACRHYPVDHLLYASSSSVYGNQQKTPFSTDDNVDSPISLYAATKKSNELMAYTYSHLYDIAATGLRFFTVYGPYGRPDMAYFGFTKKIYAGESIKIFNNGDMYRDFTYVDDIVKGIENMLCNPPAEQKGARHKVYNIGNNNPENLMYFIETLEKALGKTAQKEFLPMQAGDVYQTYADVSELMKDFDFKPATSIEEGLGKFAKWYKNYYKIEE